MTEGSTTVLVEHWLRVLPGANAEEGRRAHDELFQHGKRRLEALCRKMFYQSLRGTVIDWEDVYQESALRLWKSLDEVRPQTARAFFGLAATQIRRVLIDLCRKFHRELPRPDTGPSGSSYDPAQLVIWTEFHERAGKLPEPLREVFELLWYHELSQKEAAALLEVDESTVKRRWRQAKEQLADVLRPDAAE